MQHVIRLAEPDDMTFHCRITYNDDDDSPAVVELWDGLEVTGRKEFGDLDEADAFARQWMAMSAIQHSAEPKQVSPTLKSVGRAIWVHSWEDSNLGAMIEDGDVPTLEQYVNKNFLFGLDEHLDEETEKTLTLLKQYAELKAKG